MRISKGPHCSAVNCSNNRGKNPGLSFFTFPINPERSKKWVINCGREDLLQKTSEYLRRNCRLCTMHFEQNQFMNTNRNSLIKTAVPTIFNISDNPKQLAHRKRAPAATNELQPPQKSRSKGCGSCNRGTEEMTEIEGLPLNVNIIKEEITEEEPANEQYVDMSNFSPFYNVVIKEEHAEQKEADSEQNIEQRVTLLAQGKKNLQAEPSDEDEEAVDNYKFVDQCVLLPVITEAEGKETGECNINIREKSDQHTTGEIEETIGHVEQGPRKGNNKRKL